MIEKITKSSDEELCLMMEEETAWMFGLPPHKEAHRAPFVGDELFTLYTEITRRLRKYSKTIKKLTKLWKKKEL